MEETQEPPPSPPRPRPPQPEAPDTPSSQQSTQAQASPQTAPLPEPQRSDDAVTSVQETTELPERLNQPDQRLTLRDSDDERLLSSPESRQSRASSMGTQSYGPAWESVGGPAGTHAQPSNRQPARRSSEHADIQDQQNADPARDLNEPGQSPHPWRSPPGWTSSEASPAGDRSPDNSTTQRSTRAQASAEASPSSQQSSEVNTENQENIAPTHPWRLNELGHLPPLHPPNEDRGSGMTGHIDDSREQRAPSEFAIRFSPGGRAYRRMPRNSVERAALEEQLRLEQEHLERLEYLRRRDRAVALRQHLQRFWRFHTTDEQLQQAEEYLEDDEEMQEMLRRGELG